MDAGATTVRAVRVLYPYQLVRGQTQTLTCPMYEDGTKAAPSGGTVDIERPDGTKLVDGGTVVIADDEATYSLSSSVLDSDEDFGAQWQVIWSLTYASGVTPEINQIPAVCVRRFVRNTVTPAELYRRNSSLDPAGNQPIHSLTNAKVQEKIDLAWGYFLRRLIKKGKRPDLITTPTALHDYVFAKSMEFLYQDFATRLNEAYQSIADRWGTEAAAEWDDLQFGIDQAETGRQPDTITPARPTLWLGGSPYV